MQCCGTRTRWGQCLCFLHIGRVIAGRAVHDRIFTGGCDHLELFAQVTTDGAAVCGNCAVRQPEAVENAAVGLGHDLVAGLGRVLVAVKAVRVLHDEFTTTHQAEAGAALVAELGLDLVKVFGQLLVALDFLAGDVGHHLFAGGLHYVVAVVAVFDAKQLGAHLVKAAGLLPQLRRLDNGHRQFDGASPVHFFTNDGFHLADHPQAHRHVVVNASTQLFDHARTHHELVAHHFGIGGCFFEGGNQKLGGFHGSLGELQGASDLDAPHSLCIMNEV